MFNAGAFRLGCYAVSNAARTYGDIRGFRISTKTLLCRNSPSPKASNWNSAWTSKRLGSGIWNNPIPRLPIRRSSGGRYPSTRSGGALTSAAATAAGRFTF
jgi:hypothetical protein